MPTLSRDVPRTALASLLLALLATTSGCASQPAPASERTPRAAPAHGRSNPWTGCYANFRPAGNPKGDLSRLGRACGPPAGLRPVTPARTRYQRERDPVHPYPLRIAAPGHCYRIFAVGDAHVRDLDLVLRAPDGEEIAADLSHDAWPVLPPRAALCLDAPGLYVLEVSVFRGAGYYSVQIWGR